MQRLPDKELSRQFLLAWHDSVQYMGELVPLIVKTMGVAPEDIFYERHFNPDFVWPDEIEGTDWSCMFHGIGDCSVTHKIDGRHLEISFGLNGRYDHGPGWGTLRYIMSSKPPWPEYSTLKTYLAKKLPPYNSLSGSHKKMRHLTDQLYQLPLFRESGDKIEPDKFQQIVKLASNEGLTLEVAKDVFESTVTRWPVLNELGQELIGLNLPKNKFYQLWNDAGLAA